MKKIICLLLCAVMMLGLCAVAYADEPVLLIAPAPAPPITVYVTINDKCQLAKTADGKLATMLEVRDAEGCNLDEIFKAVHALYCPQGMAGYESEETQYGISMVKAWGQDNGSSYGYYINNQMSFSCSDIVHDGDVIDLFVYKDMAGFSDLYTKIESKASDVEGQTAVTVSYFYFDENFALASAALEGAEIYTIKNDKMTATGIKTDKDGKCLVSPADAEFLAAVKEDCVVSVTKPEVYKAPVFEDFTDLKAGEWYETAIKYFLANKYANGTGDALFAPGRQITKGEVLTLLWRMEGEVQANLLMNYDDVKEEQWYTEAVRWALAKGMVEPKNATTFGVSDPCTREEVASMIYKYIQSNGGGFTGSWMFFWDKEDKADVSDAKLEACMFMDMNEIMQGQSATTFNPKASITRAEVCQIIYNYQTKYLNK